MLNKLYQYYLKNKYNKLYKKIKNNPKLLETDIYDNKNIVYFIILSNNIDFLDKLVQLNNNILLTVDKYNMIYPYYAIYNSLYDIFFYIIDKILELNDKKILHMIFNNQTIQDAILEKNDIDLLEKYINKYKKYIIWYDNSTSYLSKILTTFKNDINKINNIIELIINNHNFDLEKFFKYPLYHNSLFLLINYYYEFKINIELIKRFISFYPNQINYIDDTGRTIIYYISDENDIELLDFCIKNNADINHIVPFYNGNYDFSHYIFNMCKKDMIKYVLNLNLNFNFINYFNETPIYCLLRNKNINDNNAIEFIIDLLKKTDNWNIVNIHGQTIIHLLCSKIYIEKLYDVLKTKYFDINYKNNYLTSPLDILRNTFKSLNYENIDDKIKEFKLLVVDNYINDFILTKSTDIATNIKNTCKNLNNNECKNKILELLDKPNMTNIYHIDSSYKEIFIENYPHVNYNLHDNKYTDEYIYILLLISKYNILNIPYNNNNIDQKQLFKISNISNNIDNYKDLDKLNIFINVEDLNRFSNYFSYTIDYSILYPINIYFIYHKYFIIPYNLIESIINTINYNYKIVICKINIENYNSGHLNILLIDVYNNRIIRFEPAGQYNHPILDNKLENIFKNNEYFKNYTYYKPSDYIPVNSFQNISQELNYMNTKIGDLFGYCVAWCFWFIEFYIQNLNNVKSDVKFKSIIHKTIKKMINNGNLLNEYIRNYANYLYKLLEHFIKNNKIAPINNLDIYYKNNTESEKIMLYNLISKNFIELI